MSTFDFSSHKLNKLLEYGPQKYIFEKFRGPVLHKGDLYDQELQAPSLCGKPREGWLLGNYGLPCPGMFKEQGEHAQKVRFAGAKMSF